MIKNEKSTLTLMLRLDGCYTRTFLPHQVSKIFMSGGQTPIVKKGLKLRAGRVTGRCGEIRCGSVVDSSRAGNDVYHLGM